MDERASGSARESSSGLARPTAPGRTLPQAAPTPRAGRPSGASRLQGASAPAAARGGHGLPARHRRAVGGRRASHWAQAHPAQGLVCRRAASPRSRAAPLRMALSRRLRPSQRQAARVFHLATSVSASRSSRRSWRHSRTAVGASPTKQIVLVLDRAGWHSTQRLRVPDHVHLLFLPPYSPELQPAEHLWPLTNTVLVNRHFASIEELEDAQAARCVALQARRDLVRSTTLFHWWPQRLRKRQAKGQGETSALYCRAGGDLCRFCPCCHRHDHC